MKRPTGWRRYFRVETRKIGGPGDDCWSGTVTLINDPTSLWSTMETSEATARKAAAFRAHCYFKMVKACMTLEAT